MTPEDSIRALYGGNDPQWIEEELAEKISVRLFKACWTVSGTAAELRPEASRQPHTRSEGIGSVQVGMFLPSSKARSRPKVLVAAWVVPMPIR